MQLKFSGSIHYANGDPVSAVEVRIFDQDAAGQVDDDLTVTPGLSDAHGHFSLVYAPLRYLDYHILNTHPPDQPFDAAVSELPLPDLGDLYLPYLQFNYTFNGMPRQHRTSLGIFQKEYHLPENPPFEFLPSEHGFHFTNKFSGYFLPFSTPAFMSSRKVPSIYGLCGGMCAAAYDFLLAGIPIPDHAEVPRQGTRLHRYLFRRQMDSLGGIGQQVVKVAQWTSLPDDTLAGTQARTRDEFSLIQRKLDDRNPVVLALIYEHASSLKELSRLIFNNHQVLAYAYQHEQAGEYAIRVYDPNLPGRDDVTIRVQPLVLGEASLPEGTGPVMGFKSSQLVAGVFYRDVRGFFAMPYVPVKPPGRV